MVIECGFCEINVAGEVIASYIIDRPDDPMEAVKYFFVKCPKCQEPVVMKSNRILELNTIDWGNPVKVYPTESFHLNPIIPPQLRSALAESIKCYKAGSFTATAIMCRRTLEGFCKLKNINESNLLKSLQKLKDNNEINDQLFEWADALRLSGNEAAHDIDSTISGEDAKDILDFTIAILDFSYSFKEKFKKFKDRNNKKRRK